MPDYRLVDDGKCVQLDDYSMLAAHEASQTSEPELKRLEDLGVSIQQRQFEISLPTRRQSLQEYVDRCRDPSTLAAGIDSNAREFKLSETMLDAEEKGMMEGIGWSVLMLPEDLLQRDRVHGFVGLHFSVDEALVARKEEYETQEKENQDSEAVRREIVDGDGGNHESVDTHECLERDIEAHDRRTARSNKLTAGRDPI